MKVRVVELTDPELREAISEWVAKHTPHRLTGYAGVIDKKSGRISNCGTYDFPNFAIEVVPTEAK